LASATPSFATRCGLRLNDRSAMTGLFGLVSTSITGAKSRSMPQAESSCASILPTRSAMETPLIPASPPASSMAPSRRMLGHSVQCGPRRRCTRPPS
jgi:hypothetical protein